MIDQYLFHYMKLKGKYFEAIILIIYKNLFLPCYELIFYEFPLYPIV